VNNSLVCEPLNKFGSEEQKKKFLTPLARGEKLGGFALTEPNAGSDAAGIKTTCKKEGDGYILDGSKNFVTNGSKASYFIIFANIDKSLGHKGITAFVVERKRNSEFGHRIPYRWVSTTASSLRRTFSERRRMDSRWRCLPWTREE
jgi:alkylation response protein AidB-like acyl-CoA dehydrogenase